MRKAIQAAAAGLVMPVALILLSVAVFFPLRKTGLTSLDDAPMLVANPNVHGWTREHLRGMGFSWTFGFGGSSRVEVWRSGTFQPISWLTHAADFSLWHDNYAMHHTTSILIHAANAALAYWLFLLLLELGSAGAGRWPLRAAAAFGAAAWALQPLRVQPVGWLSTRSYLVPTFFYLLSAAAYLKGQAPGAAGWRRYAWLSWSWLALVLSLLSKSFGLTLPAAFLILDLWPLRRWKPGKRWARSAAALAAEKVPFLVAALGLFKISLMGRQGVTAGLGVGHIFAQMLTAPRLCQAVFETTYFVEKSIIPFRVLGIYELRTPWHPLDAFFGMRTVAFLAICAAALAARRKWPAGLASWAAYLLTLSPLSGLVLYDMANQISEDKYGYLASVWLGLAAASAALAALRSRGARRWIAGAGLALAAAGLCAATFSQAGLWSNQDRWWEYNVAVNPDCYLCRIVLGINYTGERRFSEALEQEIQVARRWPDYASNEYAVPQAIETCLANLPGPQRGEALSRLESEFDLEPEYPGLHYRLAQMEDQLGRLPQAIHQMALAARYDPQNGDPRFQLAVLFDKQGKRDLALAEVRQASRIGAGDSRLHLNLGLFYGSRGLLDQAIAETKLSAKLEPTLYAPHFNLGIYYSTQGRYREALAETRRAAALDATSSHARLNSGIYLMQLGDLRQARAEFKAALRIEPTLASAQQQLAAVESRLGQRAAR